jgi:hypothetical protein
MQITLTDEQYAWLNNEAMRTSVSIAELTRRALERVYQPGRRPRAGGVEISVGVWRRPDAAVVGRRPGIRLD